MITPFAFVQQPAGGGPSWVTSNLLQYIDPFASTIGGGTASDLSGNGNDATLVNSIAVTGTNDGTGGWQLDATGASAKYLDLGLANQDYTSGITLEAFFYVAAGSSWDSEPAAPMLYRDISGTENVIGMNATTTANSYNRGIIYLQPTYNQVQDANNFRDSTWHHWVITYSNSAGYTFYKDTSAVGTFSGVGNCVITGQPLYAGGPIGGNGGAQFVRGYSNALMGLTRVYTKVLSASEVIQNYDANKADYGL